MDTKDISLQKLPPQNLEAEQAVLGAIFIENEAINKALESLRAEDFYRGSHRKIFLAMIELCDQNEAIDLVTITERLRKKGELEDVGGASYLASLVDVMPTAANIKFYAKIIREKAILRNLINTATEIATRSYEDTDDVDLLLDDAEKKIFEISENKINPSFFTVKSVVKDSFKTIERLYEKKELVTGVPTGFTKFDELTSGLQSSDLIIIAGRPSMGKTSFCLCVAQYVGIEAKLPVAIFSLEMSKEQLVLRMLCSEAKVDAHKLRSGFLSKGDWAPLTNAAGRLSEAPIFIDDTPAISVLEIRAKARRLKADQGVALIIVDYLQLMRGTKKIENRQQEISEISRSLKALAKELNVPVIALSQLSRAVEMRGGDKRPQLADLRESGAIEQDGDVIAFIYRSELYNEESEKGIAEIIIRKQRNGPIGTIKLAFLKEFTKFENLEERYMD